MFSAGSALYTPKRAAVPGMSCISPAHLCVRLHRVMGGFCWMTARMTDTGTPVCWAAACKADTVLQMLFGLHGVSSRPVPAITGQFAGSTAAPVFSRVLFASDALPDHVPGLASCASITGWFPALRVLAGCHCQV